MPSFWGLVKGGLVAFTGVLIFATLALLGLFDSFMWLPETLYGFHQFARYAGWVGAFGALLVLLLLTGRWLAGGLRRSFFA